MPNPTIEITGYTGGKIRPRELKNLRRQVSPHHSPPFHWWGGYVSPYFVMLSVRSKQNIPANINTPL